MKLVWLHSSVTLHVTHHSLSLSLHKLDNTSRVLVPQVDVSAITATDHKLTAWPIEVHALHCEKDMKKTQELYSAKL